MPAIKKEKKKPVKKSSRSKYVFAVGRRKRSVARVRLFQGSGKTLVNGKPIEEYFSGEVARVKYSAPLELVGEGKKFYALVKVVGGGFSSQLGAFVHGLARALNLLDGENYRPALKKAGLLTRDPREKERRKPGYAQKSRKRKQSPKR